MKSHKSRLVSVIIPTYNRAHLLGGAIQSVLAQTYQDFEIIIVDDNSSDTTQDVLKGFCDSRIRCVRLDSHQGAGSARNIGIGRAQGEFVAFLDSDDSWHPNKLSKQLEKFQIASKEAALVYCGFISHSHGGIAKKEFFRERCYEDFLRRASGVSTSSLLIRRSILNEMGGFDTTLESSQDFDLLLRIPKSHRIDYVDEVLLDYNRSGESISCDMEAKIQGIHKIIEKYHDDIVRLKIRHLYFLRLGLYQFLAGEWEKSRRTWLIALRCKPLYFKLWQYFIVSLFGVKIFKYVLELKKRLLIQAKNKRADSAGKALF